MPETVNTLQSQILVAFCPYLADFNAGVAGNLGIAGTGDDWPAHIHGCKKHAQLLPAWYHYAVTAIAVRNVLTLRQLVKDALLGEDLQAAADIASG